MTFFFSHYNSVSNVCQCGLEKPKVIEPKMTLNMNIIGHEVLREGYFYFTVVKRSN